MSEHSTRNVQRTAWMSLLAGPIAWAVDESIALVIAAGACGGAMRSGATGSLISVVVALVALAVVAYAAATAHRLRQRTPEAGYDASVIAERTRFMAGAALIVSALTGFGIVLRLVSALTGMSCA